ncbi:MAG: hypothetical protein Q3972_00850 [Corynebacterium sp.]|nr:hypothetical protein [Corynebacterium sp.]
MAVEFLLIFFLPALLFHGARKGGEIIFLVENGTATVNSYIFDPN